MLIEILLAIYGLVTTAVLYRWRGRIKHAISIDDENENLHRQIGSYQDRLESLQESYDKVYAVAEKAKKEKADLEKKIMMIPSLIAKPK